MRLTFFSHPSQIASYGFIAERLKEVLNLQTELWVLGEPAVSKGRRHNSFDETVDLLAGIDLEPTSEQQARHRKWFCQLEDELGERFYHRDVAVDRMFQQTNVNRRDIVPVEWDTKRVGAAMYHAGRTIQRRLQSRDIRAVFAETNSAPKRLAWRLARLEGIEFFEFRPCRHWPQRGFIKRSLGFEWEACRSTYRQFQQRGISNDLRNLAKKQLDEITTRSLRAGTFEKNDRANARLLDRLKPNRLVANQWRWLRSHLLSHRRNPSVPPSKTISPLAQIRRFYATRQSTKFYEKHFERDIDPPEKFAVYFLHVQPEATVETMAFEYQDQVATLRNLVSYLPADMPLYVKEHKPIAGDRPMNFYTELAHIPNIELVHDTVHSHKLIEESSLVLTLTGTVGLEAIYYQTPAVVLGDVFFNQFKGVHHPESLNAARTLLARPNELESADREDAVITLAATYAASEPGIFPPRPNENPSGSSDLVKSVKTFLTEHAGYSQWKADV